jgi:hypothetical protein
MTEVGSRGRRFSRVKPAASEALRVARRVSPAAPWILGLLVYAAFVLSSRATVEGAMLQVMGFDPDRADLIVALTIAAACAAVACLPRGERLVPSIVGLLAGIASFGPVFVRETQVALEPVPPNGPFDPVGWTLTLVALLTTGLAASWAAAVLCGEIRAPARKMAAIVNDAAHRRVTNRRDAGPPAATLVVAVLFLACTPVLMDLLTAMPDVRMSSGGAPGVYFGPGPGIQQIAGVAGDGDNGSTESPGAGRTDAPSSGPTETASVGSTTTPDTPSAGPSDTGSSSAVPTSHPTPAATRAPGVLFAPGPWLAWRPSGKGSIVALDQPAPWTGGFGNVAGVAVYLPPGYDAGTRHYPVFYQAPWGYGVWDSSYHISAVLDSLIVGGRIPASIFVFATDWGAPYSPSECSDSADGLEWFDRYIATTLVPLIDDQFRTIKTPAARVAWGFSDGAHCAATLALRHPDVFGQSIVISGLYPNDPHDLPPEDLLAFGNDPAVMAAFSPVALARELPAAQRKELYFIVAGDPADPAFGPSMSGFVDLLNNSGYPVMELRVSVIHGWDQIRRVFPTTLQEAAARMTDEGVFAGS